MIIPCLKKKYDFRKIFKSIYDLMYLKCTKTFIKHTGPKHMFPCALKHMKTCCIFAGVIFFP